MGVGGAQFDGDFGCGSRYAELEVRLRRCEMQGLEPFGCREIEVGLEGVEIMEELADGNYGLFRFG